MQRLLRENGLSIVWLGLFFFTLIFGQSVAGHREYDSDQQEHGRPEVTYAEYSPRLKTGRVHFSDWEISE